MKKNSRISSGRPREVFHIWADGRFNSAMGLMTGGYVIYRGRSQIFDEKRDDYQGKAGIVLGAPPGATSLVAKILSCARALGKMDDGAEVRLHSDCGYVVKHVREGNYAGARPNLTAALRVLFREVSRMKDVRPVCESSALSPNIGVAHRLAQDAERLALGA